MSLNSIIYNDFLGRKNRPVLRLFYTNNNENMLGNCLRYSRSTKGLPWECKYAGLGGGGGGGGGGGYPP